MAMEQKQQEDAQAGQGEAAKAQAEIQVKQMSMQLDAQKQQHDMGVKEAETAQKLKHNDDLHNQKLAQAEAMHKIQMAAQLQQMAAQMQKMELEAAQMKARIHAQSKAAGRNTSDL